MLVIDGQQRLTTMLIVMTALCDMMKIYEKSLKKETEKLKNNVTNEQPDTAIDNLEWLLDKLNQEIANLRYFSTDTNSNRERYIGGIRNLLGHIRTVGQRFKVALNMNLR